MKSVLPVLKGSCIAFLQHSPEKCSCRSGRDRKRSGTDYQLRQFLPEQVRFHSGDQKMSRGGKYQIRNGCSYQPFFLQDIVIVCTKTGIKYQFERIECTNETRGNTE